MMLDFPECDNVKINKVHPTNNYEEGSFYGIDGIRFGAHTSTGEVDVYTVTVDGSMEEELIDFAFADMNQKFAKGRVIGPSCTRRHVLTCEASAPSAVVECAHHRTLIGLSAAGSQNAQTYEWTLPTHASGSVGEFNDAGAKNPTLALSADHSCNLEFDVGLKVSGYGQELSCSVTVKATDTTKPMFLGVKPTDMTDIACDDVPVALAYSAVDNCDTDVKVNYVEGIENVGVGNTKEVITRTWSATDACGNEEVMVQTIRTADGSAPVVTPINADACTPTQTVACDDVPLTCMWEVEDNCDDDVQVSYVESTKAGSCSGGSHVIQTLTRTWTFTDSMGNQERKTQDIHIIDDSSPTFISTPENILEVECDAVPSFVCLEAVDACTESVKVVNKTTKQMGADINTYTLVHTNTVSDNCNNNAEFIQTVNVVDRTAPTLSCDYGWEDIEVGSPHELNQLEDIADHVSTVDNCDEDAEILYTRLNSPGDCPNQYTINHEFTARDVSGNSAAATKKVIVDDKDAPEFNIAPVDIAASCDAIPEYQVAAVDAFDGNVQVAYSKFSEPVDSTTFKLTRTWAASDSCDNTATMTQIVDVSDTEGPKLYNLPHSAAMTIECDEVSDFPPAAVDVGDNCENLCSPTLNYAEVRNDKSNPHNYELHRTWTAVDCSDHETTFKQVITVVDSTAPVLSGVPTDTSMSCDNVADISDFTVTATDNCEGTVDVVPTATRFDEKSQHVYSLRYTWSATDSSGNKAEESVVINVYDSKAPAISLPVDATVKCEDFAAPTVGDVSATDNCNGVTELDVKLVSTTEDFPTTGCENTYVTVFTFSATDTAGHVTSGSQTLTVQDVEDPVFNGAPAAGDAHLTLEAGDVIPTYSVTVSDNCQDAASMTVSFSENEVDRINKYCYTLKREWTVDDSCGNSQSTEQTIVIKDTTAPTLSFRTAGFFDVVADKPTLGDYRRFAEAYEVSNPGLPTISCDDLVDHSDLDYDIADVDDDITVVENTVTINTGTCLYEYYLFLEIKVTDGSGNTQYFYKPYKVVDSDAPSLTVDADDEETVQCLSGAFADYEPPAISYDDNCSTQDEIKPAVTFNKVNVNGASFDIVHDYSVTDACGHKTDATTKLIVKDDVAPVIQVNNVPGYNTASATAAVTIECGDSFTPSVTAADNCRVASLLSTVVDTSGQSACGEGTIAHTYVATDATGNVDTVVITVTVDDTTPPSFDPLSTSITDISCDDARVTTPVSRTGSDVCSANVDITYADTIQNKDNADDSEYTIVRVFTATDGCGLSTSETITLTVSDGEKPTFDVTPADTSYHCGAIDPPVDVTADDNCDSAPVVDMTSTPKQYTKGVDVPHEYTFDRVWEATDSSDNSNSYTQTITVYDTTAPVFKVGGSTGPVTYEACSTIPAPPTVTAEDGCEGSVDVVADQGDKEFSFNGVDYVYSFNNTWSTADSSGNTDSMYQTVTIEDTTKPVFTTPATHTAHSCDNVPQWPVVEWNECDSEPEVKFLVMTKAKCPHTYIDYQLVRVTDRSGNTAQQTSSRDVKDDKAPVIVLPEDFEAEVAYSCEDVAPAPVLNATDNCGKVSMRYEITDRNEDGNAYTELRKWTFIDECDNAVSVEQSVSVTDDINPTWSSQLPQDEEVAHNRIPSSSIVEASDNCDDDVRIEFEELVDEGDCACADIIERHWVATDANGNTIKHSQTIRLYDEEAPELSSYPADLTDVEVTAIPSPVHMNATDDCAVGETKVTFVETRTAETNKNEFTIMRTWVGTDDCGNEVSHTQEIKVVDTIDPELEGVPANLVLTCMDDIPAPPVVSHKSDHGSDAHTTVNMEESIAVGSCPQNFVVTRVWTATDAAGNTDTDTRTITVTDETKPSFDSTPSPSVTYQIDAIAPGATVTAIDNCEVGSSDNAEGFKAGAVDVVFEDLINPTLVKASDPTNYSFGRKWTAKDACGNEAVFTQHVTVEDTTAPVFTAFSNMNGHVDVSCDNIPTPPTPTATDNGGEAVTITHTEVHNTPSCANFEIKHTWVATDTAGNHASATLTYVVTDKIKPTLHDLPSTSGEEHECESDRFQAPDVTASDSCSDINPVVYTATALNTIPAGANAKATVVYEHKWTVTDACGNSESATYQEMVVDSTSPVIDVSATLVRSVEMDCTSGSPDVYNDPPYKVTDSCDLDLDKVTVTKSTIAGTCADNYVIVVEYSSTDASGNTATVTERVTVQDSTSPGISEILSDVNAICDNVPAQRPVTPVDASCGTPSVSMSSSIENQDNPDHYDLVYHYHVTDDCGNTEDFSYTVFVRDDVAPKFTSLTSLDFECEEGDHTVTATDNCDDDVDIVLDSEDEEADCPHRVTMTRQYTGTDNSGNEQQFTVEVNMFDNKAPTFSYTPATSLTVECDSVDQDAPFLADGMTASDQCEGSVDVSKDEAVFAGSSVYDYTLKRTWTATDACGNSHEVKQTVLVEDTTAPTFVLPADTSVSCEDSYLNSYPAAVVEDNCANAGEITVDNYSQRENIDCENVYDLVRYYKVTDVSGNQETKSYRVNVYDKGIPEYTSTPTDVTFECDKVPAPGFGKTDFDYKDNCDDKSRMSLQFIERKTVSQSNPAAYELEDHYLLEDECGNSVEHVQTVTIEDSTPPTFINLASLGDITVDCADYVQDTVDMIHYDDNCGLNTGSLKLTQTKADGTCVDEATVTSTWSIEDHSGNSVSHTRTITITDEKQPDLTVTSADATIQCENAVQYFAAIVPTSASDNCDGDVDIQYADVSTKSELADHEYGVTRTWTATDNCGNKDAKVFQVNVVDTMNPRLLDSDDNEHKGLRQSTINIEDFAADNLLRKGDLRASDNCDETIEVVFREEFVAGSCPHSFVVTRFWTAQDFNGLSTFFTHEITVIDDQEPRFEKTPLATVTAACTAIVAGSEADVGEVTDNSQNNPVAAGTVTLSYSFTTVAKNNVEYTENRVWTASDLCGNVKVVTQTYVVDDKVEPVLTGFNGALPADITVDTDHVPSVFDGMVVVSDNCDTNVELVFTDSITAGACADEYTIRRVWSATDSAGNHVKHEQIVTVQDQESPVLHNLPADITSEYPSVPSKTDGVFVTDNSIGADDIDIQYTETNAHKSGDRDHEYVISRKWSAVDACGNSVSHTQKINIVDTKPAIFDVKLEDGNLECDAVINAVDNPPSVTAIDIDNYDDIMAEILQSADELAFKYHHDDGYGNTNSMTQTFKIVDTTPPYLTRYPQDVEVGCEKSSFPLVPRIFALDNCHEFGVDAFLKVEFSEERSDGTSVDDYTLTRTWSAKDKSGNTVSHTQKVHVFDQATPVFLEHASALEYSCTDDTIPSEFPDLLAYDNCDDDLTISRVVADLEASCANAKTTKITWSTTDRTGNSASASQTVSIVDHVAPVYVSAGNHCVYPPNDQVVEIESFIGDLDVYDECGGDISYEFVSCNSTQAAAGENACTYDADADVLKVEASTVEGDDRDYFVYISATDVCGNTKLIKDNLYTVYDLNTGADTSSCLAQAFEDEDEE